MNKKTIITSVVAVVFVFGILGYFYLFKSNPSESKINEFYIEGSLRNNPKPLQDYFLSNVKTNKNDKNTKMAAYWIGHRFNDNGGDVKEIYDYIQSNPSLSFLNEAEQIYPKNFAELKEGKILKDSYAASYINLAYMEVLEKYGYADVAMLGTLANKYAEFAYYNRNLLANATSSDYVDIFNKLYVKNSEKSLSYFKKASPLIKEIIDGKDDITIDTDTRDVLVGINQYMLASAYYKSLGIDSGSVYDIDKLYMFADAFSKKNVPSLYHFTHYLYLVSLGLNGEIKLKTESYLDSVAYPITVLGDDKYVTKMILHSKWENSFYGKENLRMIGSHSGVFRNWLIKNSDSGWKETDFNKKLSSSSSATSSLNVKVKN